MQNFQWTFNPENPWQSNQNQMNVKFLNALTRQNRKISIQMPQQRKHTSFTPISSFFLFLFFVLWLSFLSLQESILVRSIETVVLRSLRTQPSRRKTKSETYLLSWVIFIQQPERIRYTKTKKKMQSKRTKMRTHPALSNRRHSSTIYYYYYYIKLVIRSSSNSSKESISIND